MRYLVIFVVLVTVAMHGEASWADSISHRTGLSGRIGAALPLGDDFINGTSKTQSGFVGGGGLIYGINDSIAAEVEASHIPELNVEVGGGNAFEAALTDVSVGFQYRFFPQNRLVPFIGAGADFVSGNLQHANGTNYRLDWAYGGHVSTGLDWFVTHGVALTVDLRGVFAADADVVNNSIKVSEYSPRWFQGSLGVRLMLPEHF